MSAGRERVVAPTMALGPGHTVHVAYYDLGDDVRDYLGLEGPTWEHTWSLVLATSFDGGRRFRPGSVVDDSVVPPERVMLIFTMPPPAIVAVPGAGVCIAWPDGRHGDPDALVRCSPDAGRTWRRVRRLNDDPVGNGVHQSLPHLSVSPGGRLDAVFLDRRRDPANVRNDVFLAYSTDGGRRFAPNLRLSRESSDSRVGQQYLVASARGRHDLGARLGLLSRRSDSLVAWPDTRNSVQSSTEQDIVAATLALPAPARGPRLLLLVAGAAAGLLALSLAAVVRRRARHGRASLPLAVAAVAVMCAGACRSPAGGAGPALPSPPPVVDIAMGAPQEYGFRYDRRVPGGRVLFRVANEGTVAHELVLLPLGEELPPIDAQLQGTTRAVVAPFAAVRPRRPGDYGMFAVDLVPGQRYALLCFIVDATGRSHALQGMSSEFRAGRGA